MPDRKYCIFCNSMHDAGEPGGSSLHSAYICPDCAAEMAKGITFVGVSDSPKLDGQPALCIITYSDNTQRPVYCTGEWLVLTPEAVRRLFDPSLAERAIEDKFALVTPQTLEGLKDVYKNTMMPEPLTDEEMNAHDELKASESEETDG